MKKFLILFTAAIVISLIACGNKNKQEINSNIERQEVSVSPIQSKKMIPSDVYSTGTDSVYVTLVGHGSLMFEYKGKIMYIDPYSAVADYTKLPKADLILLTHEHGDHLDVNAIDAIKKEDTHFIVSKICNEQLGYGDVMSNGDKTEWENVKIEAVPAYNIVNKKPNGEHYHPKGRGNGYILTFDSLRIYVGADTENIPEMDKLKNTIDIAFLPKNLPYTMTDEMFIDAAKKVSPKYLYPYHFSEFNEAKISKALEGTNIKLVIRPMKNN